MDRTITRVSMHLPSTRPLYAPQEGQAVYVVVRRIYCLAGGVHLMLFERHSPRGRVGNENSTKSGGQLNGISLVFQRLGDLWSGISGNPGRIPTYFPGQGRYRALSQLRGFGEYT